MVPAPLLAIVTYLSAPETNPGLAVPMPKLPALVRKSDEVAVSAPPLAW